METKTNWSFIEQQKADDYSLKIGLTTLGCKVNQCESTGLAQDLRKNNFTLVPFNSTADIYIINTCTVTASSDYQSRQLISRAHRMNPQAKIIVTGCYAQVAAELLAQIKGVSLVVGNNEKQNIASFLKEDFFPVSRIRVGGIFRQEKFCALNATWFRGRTRAFLKIQDGCDSFCSYCIVPFARGQSRSMPQQDVIAALDGLVRENYQEAVLTGIHLGAYGQDLKPAVDLASLLSRVFEREGKMRIRLSSIEPREVTAELLKIFPRTDLLCPHLHIPLQSGDDRILKLMKRNYDTSFFGNLIDNICSSVKDIAVGVDVMAGFPSETDEQFKKTLSFLENLPVAYFHVFPYSDRPQTPAQNIGPKVPPAVKKDRTAILRNLGEKKREEFALRFLGKTVQVLAEKTKDKKTGMLTGFSQNYLPFLMEGEISSKANKILSVRAEKYSEGKLYGKIVS